MRDCGLALLWFSQSILVAIVTRDVEELEKNLVAFVTMTFQFWLEIFEKSCGNCDKRFLEV